MVSRPFRALARRGIFRGRRAAVLPVPVPFAHCGAVGAGAADRRRDAPRRSRPAPPSRSRAVACATVRGAGSGHFTYFLIQSGYNPTSFGFNKPGLFENELVNLKLNFVQGDGNEPTLLPFSDERFDAVSSVGVLEHVREFGGSEEGSLKEINRILKKGGIFFCYHFPNKYSWIEFVARLTGKWNHQYRFSKANIDQLFVNDLWQVLECRQYAILPRNILGRLLQGRFRKSVIV